ncbi:MAG: sensor histidine kinase [Cyclobacteriaceae bacterium]
MIKSAETNEEILARIGHDLKGMLARIRSCNYTLFKNFENEIDDENRKFFETIERDCTTIKSIIHNLISVDRCLEEDPLQQPRPVIINRIVKQVAERYPASLSKSKDVKVIFEDLEEEATIYMDEVAIRRVIEQLLSNAVKYSIPGTEVIVKLVKYANVINISVSDQGIGIPKRLRPYIFSKFSKATRRGTEGEESSGLGLYLAKKIVERHQGSIWYESEEGQGTNFFVNLPIRDRI